MCPAMYAPYSWNPTNYNFVLKDGARHSRSEQESGTCQEIANEVRHEYRHEVETGDTAELPAVNHEDSAFVDRNKAFVFHPNSFILGRNLVGIVHMIEFVEMTTTSQRDFKAPVGIALEGESISVKG